MNDKIDKATKTVVIDQDTITKIEKVLDSRASCLCSMRESCEACEKSSLYNTLRNRLLEIINGPKPALDYGKTVAVLKSDVMADG